MKINISMGTNSQEHEISEAGSEVTYPEIVENEVKDIKKGATHKIIAESCKSNSMVLKVTMMFQLLLCLLVEIVLLYQLN